MDALRFDLSGTPVAPEEQARFDADLGRLGLDASIWGVLNATLTTGSSVSKPLLLRARRGAELAGVALVIECRRLARCVTRNAVLERTIDALNPPSFMWLRVGAGIDQYANPGFVAEGLDRETFVQGAVDALMRRYRYGCVFDDPASSLGVPTADVPFPDFGRIDPVAGERERALAASKQLRKKVRKFENKGGRVRVVDGPMPEAEATTIAAWLGAIDPEVRVAFQDLYPEMVAASNRLPGTVHVLAYLDDAFVGYHSFLPSGARLVCLSGIFDPERPSNYHAYENVLLAALRYAAERGIAGIDLGPVLNPTKAKLVTRFDRSALRYVSGFAPFRLAMRAAVARSRIGPTKLRDYIGLEGAGWSRSGSSASRTRSSPNSNSVAGS